MKNGDFPLQNVSSPEGTCYITIHSKRIPHLWMGMPKAMTCSSEPSSAARCTSGTVNRSISPKSLAGRGWSWKNSATSNGFGVHQTEKSSVGCLKMGYAPNMARQCDLIGIMWDNIWFTSKFRGSWFSDLVGCWMSDFLWRAFWPICRWSFTSNHGEYEVLIFRGCHQLQAFISKI